MAHLSTLGTLKFNNQRYGLIVQSGMTWCTIRGLVPGLQEQAVRWTRTLNRLLEEQHINIQVPIWNDEVREADLTTVLNEITKKWDDRQIMFFNLGWLCMLINKWRVVMENPAKSAHMEQRVLTQKQVMLSRAYDLHIDLDRLINLMKVWNPKATIIDFLAYQTRPVMVLLTLVGTDEEVLQQRSAQEGHALAQQATKLGLRLDITSAKLPENRLAALQLSLMQSQPRIAHFSSVEARDRLVLQDAKGESVEVAPESLANLLRLAVRDGLEIVIFHACYSAESARPIAEFVDNVIITRSALLEPACFSFIRSFYAALGAGGSCAEKFEWAKAGTQLEFPAADIGAVLIQKPKFVPANNQLKQEPGLNQSSNRVKSEAEPALVSIKQETQD